jgi:myo-inositol-1(or 4)-monophosphatase
MLEVVLETVKKAGEVCLKNFRRLTSKDIQFKSDRDMVTTVDTQIQDMIRVELARSFPKAGFVGEEGEEKKINNESSLFLVDPLDGTTSFVHGIPVYSISVAYREGNQTRLGVVYAPSLDLLYHAERGKGAYCNGRSIRVSKTTRLIDALAGTGFACIRHGDKPDTLPLLNEVVYRLRGLRRLGSAAVDLSFVADGRFDLFWEYNLDPWDVAAGVLIVEEAGGLVTDLGGGQAYEKKKQIAASNALVHEEFIRVARKYQ